MSFYDPLTGLKNRRGYEDIINNLSEEDNVSVVFCDANGLKTTNDNFGHLSEDELINKIANIIRNAFIDINAKMLHYYGYRLRW